MQAACQVCGPQPGVSPESLLKCSRCNAVLYCGRAHQTQDFPDHKLICKRIKKMRALMETEAHKIRNATEDMFTPANAFETNVGHFWGIHETRPYMRAKLEVIRALSIMDNRPAVEAALTEAMDCLRLCRGDNMGVRDIVSTLMLMLGKYQEAYDFVKWYATSSEDMHYDWGDMDLPYLDVHNADMTEELDELNSGDIFHLSSIAFVKMILLKAVTDAITAHELADRASLPAVVTDSLGAFLAPSGEGQTRSLAQLKQLRTKLKRQAREAFAMSHAQNKHFWGAMLNPIPLMDAPDPPFYAPGSADQIKIWIMQNAILWRKHLAFISEYR